jgi:hypothetical protein
MRKTILRILVAATAASAACAYAQIFNGSFEAGTAYSGAPNVFVSGTPAPWQATSFTPDCFDNTGVDGWGFAGIPIYDNMFAQMPAADGVRFLGFAAGSNFSEAFKQTMAPLVGGNIYTLTAQIAVDDFGKAIPYGGPYRGRGAVDVRINGTSVGQFAPNTASYTWEARSVTFVAPTASSYEVEFVAMVDPLTGLPSYMGMDDVSIVPEPWSLAAFGAGLAALARRRSRSRA